MSSDCLTHLAIMINQSEETQAGVAVQTLVARAKAGDLQAFEQLLIRHQRPVLGTAVKLLGNVADGQDAAQEVFLRLHKYLHSFDLEAEFLPWLYKMTINICRDIARKRGNNRLVSLETELQTGNLSKLQSRDNQEEAFSSAQERQIITQALNTLSEKERAVIVLRDMQGLETKEVARLLGTVEATVRSQISMARIKIKKYRDKILNRL